MRIEPLDFPLSATNMTSPAVEGRELVGTRPLWSGILTVQIASTDSSGDYGAVLRGAVPPEDGIDSAWGIVAPAWGGRAVFTQDDDARPVTFPYSQTADYCVRHISGAAVTARLAG